MAIRSLTLPLLLFVATASFAQIRPPQSFAGGRAVDNGRTHPWAIESALVASNGSGFFAAWSDSRFGSRDIVGARFDSLGAPLDEIAMPLYPTLRSSRAGAVISDGIGYVVFGQVPIGTVPARVNSDGTVQPAEFLPSMWAVAGAWNGARHAVVFRGSERERMQLWAFDSDLNPAEVIQFGAEVNYLRNAAVAAGNSRFLVVWEEWYAPTGPAHRLLMQTFDDRGKALTLPRELTSRVVDRQASSFEPQISWNGSQFVVAWNDLSAIRGAVITSEGDFAAFFQIPSVPNGMSIAWDGHSHLLVWRVAATHVYEAATLSSNAEVTSRFILHVDTTIRTAPAVASNGTMFFVIAGERRLAVTPTSTQRVRDLGLAAPAYVSQSSPVITAGTSHLLVTWQEGGTIWARRILPSGMPLPDLGAPHALGPGSGGIVAASGDDDLHLVAWRDQQAVRTRAKLIGRHGLREVEIPWMASHPLGVASNGRAFVIAWMERPGGMTGGGSELFVGVIDESGGITPRQIATSPFDTRVYALGWTGSEYALVWRKFLLPECGSITCSSAYEDRITLLDEAGNAKSEALVSLGSPDAWWINAVVSSDGVMVASDDRIQPTLRIQKFALDGTTTGPKAVNDRTRPHPLNPLRLIRTPAGYTLFGQYVTQWLTPMEEPKSATLAILLDSNGAIKNELAMGDIAVTGGIHAFGTTWITYTAPWYPLASAHDGRIIRAYYKALPGRARAVRR